MHLPRVKLSSNLSSPTQLFVIGPIIGLTIAAVLLLGLVLLLPQPVSTASAQAPTLWCGDGVCSPEIGEQYYNCADCLSSCNWCTDQAFCESIQPEEEWFFVPGFKGCSTQGCCIHIPPPDGTPPVTTAVLDGTQGLNGWYVSPVTVTLVATDNQSGVYSTNLDGEAYTGPRVYDAEGATTIAYQSYDNAGNLEALKSTTFYIDTVAPSSTVVVPAQSGQWFHGELMIAGTSTDVTSGVGGVEVSLDGGATWQPATGGEVWAFTWNTKSFADGLYGVRVRGTDQAGNVETPVSIDIGVDTSGPFFDVGPFPGEHCFGCSGPITFKLTAFDDQSKIENTAIVVKKDGKDVRVIKAPNGELRGVPVVWDGLSDQGQPVPPGDYQLLFYTANRAGLFGSYGAGIRVVDALPAAPAPAPLAPVDPPEHTPWIMTPIPPTPAAPVSGESTGLVSAAPQQAGVVSQTTVSSNTSALTSATSGTSGKNNGAAATGAGALLVAAAAYIAARQKMGDKSLGQKLAELAGQYQRKEKPAAPPTAKVAPPLAPPPPPPAPARAKPLRWGEIPHTPPAPAPKPVYYSPLVVKPTTKHKWFSSSSKPPMDMYARSWVLKPKAVKPSRPPIPTYARPWLPPPPPIPLYARPWLPAGYTPPPSPQPIRYGSYTFKPPAPPQPKPQTGGLFGGLVNAVNGVSGWAQNAQKQITKTASNAWEWMDKHQELTSVGVGIGVGIAAVAGAVALAALTTVALPAIAVAGIALGVGALAMSGLTLALNATHQRPLGQNLVRNSVLAGGIAALVPFTVNTLLPFGHITAGNLATIGSMVGLGGLLGNSFVGAAIGSTIAAGISTSLGYSTYGMANALDPTLPKARRDWGRDIAAKAGAVGLLFLGGAQAINTGAAYVKTLPSYQEYQVEGINASEPSAPVNIALGLREDVDENPILSEFADKRGALFVDQWADANLYDPSKQEQSFTEVFYEVTEQVLETNGTINVNLDHVDLNRTLSFEANADLYDTPGMGYTDWEIRQILNNEELYNHTDWYLNGKVQTEEELKALGLVP